MSSVGFPPNVDCIAPCRQSCTQPPKIRIERPYFPTDADKVVSQHVSVPKQSQTMGKTRQLSIPATSDSPIALISNCIT